VSLSLLARAVRAAGGAEAFAQQIGLEQATALIRRARLGGAPAADAEPIPWRAVGRPEQLLPAGDDWLVWLILAGRGFGKTRVGAETVVEWVQGGTYGRLTLVAPTAADTRDVMVEGESGLIAVSEAAGFPVYYEPSKRRLTWPNGAIATLYSAEEPDRLRGPQHDAGWCDEIAAWKDPVATWDQLQFGMRLGPRPRIVVTTTPRPVPIVRRLLGDEKTVVTRGSTFDNADNLAPSFLTNIRNRYEGTRLGRQELYAEVLDDNPGALWKMARIEALRVLRAPELQRVVVAVDPSGSSHKRGAAAADPSTVAQRESDEVGIGAAGVGMCRCKCINPWDAPELHGFVLADVGEIMTPAAWAAAAAKLYRDLKADRLVAEVNFGGELVESNIRTLGDPTIAFKAVHASRGKVVRAEPVAGLYEQLKVHHVGVYPKLEDEMTQWNPLTDTRSPNRVDWLVWALTELMLDGIQPRWTGGRSKAIGRQ
jgi:phage terminase large subunit-like protein